MKVFKFIWEFSISNARFFKHFICFILIFGCDTAKRADFLKKIYIVAPNPRFFNPCKTPGTVAFWDKLEESFDLKFFNKANGSWYKIENNKLVIDIECNESYAKEIIDTPNLFKIICFDPFLKLNNSNIPKEKVIMFHWEPWNANRKYSDFYSRIYTFNDTLVDEKKFFKYYYPVLEPMLSKIPRFDEKKLCTMIVRQWYKDRKKILNFFSQNYPDSLDVYGSTPPGFAGNAMIKGSIPGWPSSQEKYLTLAKYKFCICFENSHHVPGYITEKIFDVFAGGCVPIYWGPNNIEEFIPSDCFINFRKFSDYEDLYQFLISLTDAEYDAYLNNIRHFLQSDKAKLFSKEHFEDLIYQAILQ